MDLHISVVILLNLLLPMVASEAFSSTAHLKLLSQAEGEVVSILHDYLAAEENRLQKIRK